MHREITGRAWGWGLASRGVASSSASEPVSSGTRLGGGGLLSLLLPPPLSGGAAARSAASSHVEGPSSVGVGVGASKAARRFRGVYNSGLAILSSPPVPGWVSSSDDSEDAEVERGGGGVYRSGLCR